MTENEKKIIKEIESFARQKLNNNKQSHDWDHTQRVTVMALQLATTEQADFFIVQSASLLHDIGRSLENEIQGQKCHAIYGSQIAFDFLSTLDIEKQKIIHICDCIKTHRFRNNLIPQTLEAQIIFDADKLDSLGAIGIGRAFLFSGEIGAKLHNSNLSEKEILESKAYSEEDTAYREYLIKLKYLEKKLFTPSAIKIAKERNNFMHSFFTELIKEITGEK